MTAWFLPARFSRQFRCELVRSVQHRRNIHSELSGDAAPTVRTDPCHHEDERALQHRERHIEIIHVTQHVQDSMLDFLYMFKVHGHTAPPHGCRLSAYGISTLAAAFNTEFGPARAAALEPCVRADRSGLIDSA